MIAFLVMAHQKPAHAAHLTRRLVSGSSAVFLHVDAKSDMRPFEPVIEAGAIPAARRHKVFWGGWSQVAATLELVRTAIRHSQDFTHFALLSGVDYPLARPEAILSYVSKTGLEHINCAPMQDDENERLGKPLSRLSVRYLEGGRRQKGSRAAMIRTVNHALSVLPPRHLDRAFRGFTPHAGSQWWILSREAVEHALKVDENGGPMMRIFRTSRFPDECYFQTVVASRFGAEKIGRATHYMDWSVPKPPAVLNDAHIRLVTSDGFELDDAYGRGPALFMRKFPTDRDDLRDIVDRYSDNRGTIG